MIKFPRIRVWPSKLGVAISPTETCQMLTPEEAERLAADLIRCAYDSRKLSPYPPGNERALQKEKTDDGTREISVHVDPQLTPPAPTTCAGYKGSVLDQLTVS